MNAFTLLRPESLEQALALMPKADADRSALPLAGGQDLLTEMDEHLVEPESLIDLGRIPGLGAIEARPDGGLTLGALARLSALERHPSLAPPASLGGDGSRGPWTGLAQAAHSIASPQIRSLATVGGNLNQRPRCLYFRLEEARCIKKGGSVCYAKDGRNKLNAIFGGGPSYIVHPSDLAPMLVALDAEVELASPRGIRQLPVEQYYLLPRDGRLHTETVRAPDELLTAVHLPPRDEAWRSVYVKFKERDSYDFALVSVALALWIEGRTLVEARVCLGGVAPKPWRLPAVEAALAGETLGQLDHQALGALAVAGAEPLAENGFKLELVKGLLRRALEELSA